MPQNLSGRLSRRLACPAVQPPSVLLIGDAREIEEFSQACSRAVPPPRLEVALHVDAAWERLKRRGVYTGRDHTPALLVICRPERAGLLPFLRRLRGDARLRRIPVALLTEEGRHCPETDQAKVDPILYFSRPETGSARVRLARELAVLLPEF